MQDSPGAQVKIRASRERVELRSAQAGLNSFLWASELAYSALLSGPLATNPDNASVDDLLADVPARSWNISSAGRPHYYRRNVRNMRLDLEEATARISGAVLTSWLSEFEWYLSRRMRSTRTHWGPYSLWVSKALGDQWHQVPLDDLLRADAWREVRNLLVHEPSQSRAYFDGEEARNLIIGRMVNNNEKSGWFKAWVWWNLSGNQIEERANKILAETLGAAQTKAVNSGAPVELFCCVFAFTSIDTLAHLIEEATLPDKRQFGERTLKIRNKLVKRRDLLVGGLRTNQRAGLPVRARQLNRSPHFLMPLEGTSPRRRPVLPADLQGRGSIEFGCGAGCVSAWLRRRGARPAWTTPRRSWPPRVGPPVVMPLPSAGRSPPQSRRTGPVPRARGARLIHLCHISRRPGVMRIGPLPSRCDRRVPDGTY